MLRPVAAMTAMRMRSDTSSQKPLATQGTATMAARKRIMARRAKAVSKRAMSSAYVSLKSPQRMALLDPLDLDLAEQPVRLHAEDGHQGHEGGHLLDAAAQQGIEVAAGEVLQHPHHQPADDGPEHAVEAAEDDHRDHLQ